MHPLLARHFKHFLADTQHGFTSGLSVETNLGSFTSDLIAEVDTDFSSAFDKVDHQILVNKLSQYGIGPPLIKWFESYLHQRPQTVVVNGFESERYIARSGVPQGYHLGTLLFLAFINDITIVVKHCKCSLFADDLKIYKTAKSDEDIKLIQEDLNRIIARQ
ncbi:jg10636 [Pararge aegeria aegeria]|uniref:Jg10636 protein n=1 Tax=Pararge aegeria aegeria TaxID=348720 RepID=A0A8S4R9Z0_9NEOP|nr:jg10636 [Pararge aegeria aegeria]